MGLWVRSKIDGICEERDRLKEDHPGPIKRKVLSGRWRVRP
jgi:hypothetical protein